MNKTKFEEWKSELIIKSEPNNLINGIILNKNATYQKMLAVSTSSVGPMISSSFEVKKGVVSGVDVLKLRFPLFDTKYPTSQKISASVDEKRAMTVQAGSRALSQNIVERLKELNIDKTKIVSDRSGYNIPTLKEIAKVLNLNVSGNKSDLVDRINDALQSS
jgi:hypothetical protein